MLIIFFGESFRLGGQGNRNIGSINSYNGQMEACNSHLRFLNKNKSDVYIASYKTQYDKDLLSLYKPYLIGSTFHKNVIGMDNLIHKTINSIDISKYDSIFLIRIDLYLKDYFIEIFKPSEIILFPTICWYKSCVTNGHPRINDTMTFIPKKYYKFIKYFEFGHETWYKLMNYLTYEDIDTIIHTFHDSDSEKDLNPLYKIVNRPESKVFHSNGHIFNKYDYLSKTFA